MKKFGTAIILAGGKSSRMGFDKQFLKINEKRLMNLVIKKLEEEFDEVIIVTNKPEEYSGFSQKIRTDIFKEMGPLGGIHSGLMEASSEYSFVIACDMPNINMEYIRYMREIINDKEIDACVTLNKNNIEPLHGFYSKGIIKDIEKHLLSNRRSINSLITKLNTHYVRESEFIKFSSNKEIFKNLNTKEDLEDFLLYYNE
ncbi:molybdenum cofactor guanylyltransferase [Tissierella praeacuta]|uniref:molybdenum cofactor guanylyltransferase n=1 Tax=Tissierella praeacuta TaxID=43131 RepID=UPI0033406D3D